jgi:tRNA(Arg) A34 adenosine deaminase TadA
LSNLPADPAARIPLPSDSFLILEESPVKNIPFTLHLPHWLEEFTARTGHPFPTVEERMRLVIELSRINIREGTGGPFGAAVFHRDNGTLLACGVNLVLACRCSILHAEVVALIQAQQRVAFHDLSAAGLPPSELVTSTEPCAMCLGAVTWSGIRRLVCGARREDAEDIGFDEGEKPPAWRNALERRGIAVMENICREEAVAVLKEYRESGGTIYNPGRQ